MILGRFEMQQFYEKITLAPFANFWKTFGQLYKPLGDFLEKLIYHQANFWASIFLTFFMRQPITDNGIEYDSQHRCVKTQCYRFLIP